jgi:hypothetical protein
MWSFMEGTIVSPIANMDSMSSKGKKGKKIC